MNLAPIVLFTYNRLWHTRQTIEALKKNELSSQSELFIYSDGWRDKDDKQKVLEVRKYLKTVEGFKKITLIFREKNWGLADSIIDGVTDIVNRYEKIIVLEDDMITSIYFLNYINENLIIYENENKVASIHAYIYPIKESLPNVFFLKGADCWGWATWKNRWTIFESDGNKLLEKLFRKNLQYEFNFYNSFDYIDMLKNKLKVKIILGRLDGMLRHL